MTNHRGKRPMINFSSISSDIFRASETLDFFLVKKKDLPKNNKIESSQRQLAYIQCFIQKDHPAYLTCELPLYSLGWLNVGSSDENPVKPSEKTKEQKRNKEKEKKRNKISKLKQRKKASSALNSELEKSTSLLLNLCPLLFFCVFFFWAASERPCICIGS